MAYTTFVDNNALPSFLDGTKLTIMEEKSWPRGYKECKNCGTTEYPHIARGFCKRCYPLKLKLEHIERWDLSKPESLKGFPHSLRPHIINQNHLDGFRIDAKEQIQSRLDYLKGREGRLKGIITGIDVEYKLERIAELALRRRYKFGFFHGIAGYVDLNFNGKQRKIIYNLLNKIEEALPWEGIRYGKHAAEALVEGFKILTAKKVQRDDKSGVP